MCEIEQSMKWKKKIITNLQERNYVLKKNFPNNNGNTQNL